MQPMLDTSNLPRIPTWKPAGAFTDIRYEKAEGIAKITINRPEVRNAFRPLTVKEMIPISVLSSLRAQAIWRFAQAAISVCAARAVMWEATAHRVLMFWIFSERFATARSL